MKRRTRTNQEDHIQKMKISNDIYKRKKKDLLNNRIKEIEEAIRRNDSRIFYKEIMSLVKNNLL
jgi:hypothetical protein